MIISDSMPQQMEKQKKETKERLEIHTQYAIITRQSYYMRGGV